MEIAVAELNVKREKRRYTRTRPNNEIYLKENRSIKYTFDWYYEEFILALYISNAKEKMSTEINAINSMVYISCKRAKRSVLDYFTDGVVLTKRIGQPIQKLKVLAYAIASRINDNFLRNGKAKLEMVLKQLEGQAKDVQENKEIKDFSKECLSGIKKIKEKYVCRTSQNDNPEFKELIFILEENVRKVLNPSFIEYYILVLKFGLFGEKIHTLKEVSSELDIPTTKMLAIFQEAKSVFLEAEGNTCNKDIFLKLNDFGKISKQKIERRLK